jgi:transcriptional regulator with PAS, ATPase and Fis domain
MLAYAWPGNVRELRNVLERAMLLGRGGERIGAEHLPREVRSATAPAAPVRRDEDEAVPSQAARAASRSLADVEREHVGATLAAHEGNRTHAARALGISRATLIKKIREFGLAPRGEGAATAAPSSRTA